MNTSPNAQQAIVSHPSFAHLRTSHIDALNLDVAEYVHSKTRARHLHFRADDDNKAKLEPAQRVGTESSGFLQALGRVPRQLLELAGSRRLSG